MSVTKPDPNVVVVDDKAHVIQAGGNVQLYACLELTFDAAGALSVETTEPSPMGSYLFPRIYRPKSGATFTDDPSDIRADAFLTPDKLAYNPSTSVGSSEQIDIAQPETLQLVVALGNNNGGGPIPDGRFKFTFTFQKR